jgi:hypothetical protein
LPGTDCSASLIGSSHHNNDTIMIASFSREAFTHQALSLSVVVRRLVCFRDTLTLSSASGLMVCCMLALVGPVPRNRLDAFVNQGLVVYETHAKSLVLLVESSDLPSLRFHSVTTLIYQFAQVPESMIGIELGQSAFYFPGLQFSDMTLHAFGLFFVFPVLTSFVDWI